MHHPAAGILGDEADVDRLLGVNQHGVAEEGLVDGRAVTREQAKEHAISGVPWHDAIIIAVEMTKTVIVTGAEPIAANYARPEVLAARATTVIVTASESSLVTC